MISLKTNPELTHAVFVRLTQATEQFAGETVEQLMGEGYDPSELVWLMTQVLLSMSTAMHIKAGVPLETLLEQVRRNVARMQEAPPP